MEARKKRILGQTSTRRQPSEDDVFFERARNAQIVVFGLVFTDIIERLHQ
jgi:hypothetical protein